MKHHHQKNPDREKVLEKFNDQVEKYWEQYIAFGGFEQKTNENLYSFGERIRSALAYLYVQQGPPDQCLHCLRLVKETGVARYNLSFQHGKEMTFSVYDHLFTVQGSRSTFFMDVDSWLLALSAAMTLRDEESIAILGLYGDQDMQNSTIYNDAFDMKFRQFLKCLFDPSMNVEEAMAEVVEHANGEYQTKARKKYSDKLLVPLAEVLNTVLTSKDEKAYRAAMKHAIASHKKYYALKSHAHNPKGFLSLPLTAAAVVAFDRHGFQFEANPYIPDWLVYEKHAIREVTPSVHKPCPSIMFSIQAPYSEGDDEEKLFTVLRQALVYGGVMPHTFVIDGINPNEWTAYTSTPHPVCSIENWKMRVERVLKERVERVLKREQHLSIVIEEIID